MNARLARDTLVTALVRGLLALGGTLPSGMTVHMGRIVGVLAWAVSPRLRAVARHNLRLALPFTTEEERTRMVRHCAAWLGEAAAEAVCVARGTADLRAWVTVSTGAREALSPDPRGTVVATGHLGNWELLGAVLSSLGRETVAVVRRPRIQGLASVVTSLRGAMGFGEIARGPHAALQSVRVLRRGGIVGLLCDQASDQASVRVPFLGHPANTALGPAMLARRTGARLVVVWLRRERPCRYHLECVPVEPGTTDGETMARVNAVLGRAILQVPAAWVWFHDRWADQGERQARGREVRPSSQAVV